jgi:hypothetical protein
MVLRGTRRLGASALLAVGAVHLEQYLGNGYDAIPTIGALFLLNAVGSAVVALGLLAPVERMLRDRAPVAIGLLATGGVAIAVGSLVALFISESTSLFGFSEDGYSTAIVVAIIAEVGTVALLTPVVAVAIARAGFPRRQRQPGRVRPTWARQS